MRPIYLYIENFMCFERTELDLTAFNAALIVGRLDNNDLFSNGVGKSTIFRAIEYVLFNQVRDLKLEELIRDDTNGCKVILDFELDGKIWRISRSRTTKGTSDLSLYERNTHTEDGIEPHSNLPKEKISTFWEQKSGRRANDTELDLAKLIKVNAKGFTNSFYFAQHDFKGLASETASRRRAIFRESLPIGIYAKLEKLARDKASALTRDIEKKRVTIGVIGDPDKELKFFEKRWAELSGQIVNHLTSVNTQQALVDEVKNKVNDLTSQEMILSSQMKSVVLKKTDAEARLKRAQVTIDSTTASRKSVIDAAKALSSDLKSKKEKKEELSAIDLSQIETLKEEIISIRDEIATTTAKISSLNAEIEELKIPMPDDAVCKHCRQELTDAHRRACKNSIDEEIKEKEALILTLKSQLVAARKTLDEKNSQQKKLEILSKEKESITNQISSTEKELNDKKSVYEDYSKIIEAQKSELELAKVDLDAALKELENSNQEALLKLHDEIKQEKSKVVQAELILADLNKQLTKLNSEIAVVEHSKTEKKNAIKQKAELAEQLEKLEEEYSIYPDLLQGFSPTGIPNLIIQGLLDDLQTEANNILNQIKPGLQLEFSIEKTNSDGETDDDLDIKYFVNGRSRVWPAISGAMKVSVMFALKLGYAFLLYKTLGVNIKFLLLDEIDQPLDKAGTDALAQIIKYFSKDFTILVITHNDRLKDKFTHAIFVEQDQNMVSAAKVVTQW